MMVSCMAWCCASRSTAEGFVFDIELIGQKLKLAEMDPALLKQRQDFMKSAIKSMNAIPRQQDKASTSRATMSEDKSGGKNRKQAARAAAAAEAEKRKQETIANSMNFSVMAKIVDYLKKRHLNQQFWALSIRDILDEMQQFDIPKRTQEWLINALRDNPRITVEDDGKFIYNPPHKIKGKNSILNILRKNYIDGKGGFLLSELNDCIPGADEVMKSLGTKVISITGQFNKRKDVAYFYNDNELDYEMDEEFIQLWRQAGVEHLDEKKIEEYLQRHGIAIVKDMAPRRLNAVPKRKPNKRRVNQKVHNTHLEGVLEDYEN